MNTFYDPGAFKTATKCARICIRQLSDYAQLEPDSPRSTKSRDADVKARASAASRSCRGELRQRSQHGGGQGRGGDRLVAGQREARDRGDSTLMIPHDISQKQWKTMQHTLSVKVKPCQKRIGSLFKTRPQALEQAVRQ